MPYEIALYKAKLFDEFKAWIKTNKDDSSIPADSYLREFVGGNIFEY